MKLDEAAIRRKAIELLDMCNLARMDMWMISGVTAGVLDPDLVEKVLTEELPRRSPEVQLYWAGECSCTSRWN